MPKLVDAALENLRDEAVKQVGSGADAEARIVEILMRAAKEIRGS